MPAKKLSERTRCEIQHSDESVRSLAKRLGVSPATVCKWRKRSSSQETPRSRKAARSTVLSAGEEQLTSLFRCQTLLPLDDCLYALRLAIPSLTRSSMHRCFKRHGLTPLSMLQDALSLPEVVATNEHGHFHLSAINVQLADAAGVMLIALDRVTKYAHAALYSRDETSSIRSFILSLVACSPFPVRTVVSYIELYRKLFDVAKLDGRESVDVLTLYQLLASDSEQDASANMNTANINRTELLLSQMPVVMEDGYNFPQLEAVIANRTVFYNHAAKLKSLGGTVPSSFAVG